MNPELINALLPQTQCQECGYSGCLPYAEALAVGNATINLCAPGGEAVMHDLAILLQQPALAPATLSKPALAWIDESACIGCAACIRACPVDAIMGASKFMHTVIRNECTGCALCVAPCPVDCIKMQPIQTDYLPLARYLAPITATPRFAASHHARQRYEWRQARLQRNQQERQLYLAEREAATKTRLSDHAANTTATANSADLIAQAMARATAQQARRTVASNHETFQAQQVEAAKERAAYRRALRDAQHGNDEEKVAAIQYLRAHKTAQEEKAAKSSS